MILLLDTDCIVNHLRGKTEIIQEADTSYAMSVITLGELLYGVERSEHPKAAREAIRFFQSEFLVAVMGVTEEIAARYGSIKSELAKRGELIEDFDLVIAATAVEHKLVLATGNAKHFRRIKGLVLV